MMPGMLLNLCQIAKALIEKSIGTDMQDFAVPIDTLTGGPLFS